MGYVDHAVRRGLEHIATTHFKRAMNEEEPIHSKVPGWGIAIIVVTIISFVIFMSAVCFLIPDG